MVVAEFLSDSHGLQVWGTATTIMAAGLGPVAALAALASFASYSRRTTAAYDAFRQAATLPNNAASTRASPPAATTMHALLATSQAAWC